MKNCMTKRAITLLLVVAMLVATCVTSTASAVDQKGNAAHMDVEVQGAPVDPLISDAEYIGNGADVDAPVLGVPSGDAYNYPLADSATVTVTAPADSETSSQNTVNTEVSGSGTLTGSVETTLPQANATTSGSYFTLATTAAVNADDNTLIDVTVTVKSIKEQLDAVEFLLKFDSSKVAGVITESGADMDNFMTVKPTYTFQISGMELPASRYEQACVYDASNGYYECRFIDLLSYSNAKPGETYKGLINDGDLVITIQFKTLDTVKAGDKLSFSVTDVMGTTRDEMLSVPGTGGSAQCTAKVSGSGSSSGGNQGGSDLPTGPSGDAFTLDIEAPATADLGSQIDVVITIKNIKTELDALEFFLKYDQSKLAAVITESGSPMDALITVSPQYTFKLQSTEVLTTRYEQACKLNAASGIFECRFMDLMQYTNAKPGETYKGLINDGDLVITIPFKLLDTATEGTTLSFSMVGGSVKGTTRGDLVGVLGNADTATTSVIAAHVHTWVDATCTEPKTCSGCGATEGTVSGHVWLDSTCTTPKTCAVCSTTSGPPKGHKWTMATCEAPMTCSTCGATNGDPKDHTWIDATCTEPKTCSTCGATEGTAAGHTWVGGNCTSPSTCSVCGTAGTAATGHSWTAATCTTPSTCSVCGTVGTAATGHSWTNATCTAPKTCSVCGVSEGIPAGHTWVGGSCTTAGTCSVCGTTGAAPTGHNWIAATCTSAKTCTICGATEGAPSGHKWSFATCTEPQTCTICGATTGEAYGHQWMAATCTTPKACNLCGITSGPPNGHQWTMATCTNPMTCSTCGTVNGQPKDHQWIAATCTNPKTCSTCGATEGEANGHNWTAATCTAPKTCTVCGATEGTALGHNWGDATCTESSSCSRCGITSGGPIGHSWIGATCTAPKTCSVCGMTDGTALGHSWTDATCTDPMSCSRCGTVSGDAKGHNFVGGSCTVCGTADPDAVPEPGNTGVISGSVTSYLTNDAVTITLTASGSTEPSLTLTLPEGVSEYSLDGVEYGTYTMSVSKASHVTRDYTVTVGETATTVDVKILPIGDATGDGRVVISDVARVYAHVRKTNLITDEYQLKCADALTDGRINVGDVSRLYGHIRNITKLF